MPTVREYGPVALQLSQDGDEAIVTLEYDMNPEPETWEWVGSPADLPRALAEADKLFRLACEYHRLGAHAWEAKAMEQLERRGYRWRDGVMEWRTDSGYVLVYRDSQYAKPWEPGLVVEAHCPSRGFTRDSWQWTPNSPAEFRLAIREAEEFAGGR